MNTSIVNANIYTPVGHSAVKGNKMDELRHFAEGCIHITNGSIVYAAASADAPDFQADRVIDAGGCAVLPGFVDSHTHLIFGGYRPDEFTWRMRGDSYMSIMQRGGGIVSTMEATRHDDRPTLFHKAMKFLDRMSRMGVTTVEGKSGYGLDCENEVKQLRVLNALNWMPGRKVEVVSTFLGAHAVPPEFNGKPDEYIDFIIDHVLPKVKHFALADYCDVFCEEGVFTVEQSRRLLSEAKRLGFKLKVHADEIVNTGGAELAASIGAVSADHLLHISDAGIEALAASDTIATLLPLTAFTLREEYAPARKLIDSGCAVALATDLNPGSCFSGSIPLMFALACIYMRMSVEEAITALTINGAAALGHADTIGSLEPGKKADIVILDSDNINVLPYYTGMNSVRMTIKTGEIVAQNE